ncbi:MAG: SDR family oxidoreductase [Chloroflexi bacterium]|nr:SDR family oxidoreductase [Chloroflexota bacterium]
MGILQDKVAIVTGGARGIGRSAALAFAREGARLVINSRSEKEVSATVRHILNLGGDAIGTPGDVSSEQFVDTMVAKAMSRWGTVDILVNSAGIVGPAKPIGWDETDFWRRTMDINLTGSYLAMHAVIPIMARQKRGKIINVSSPGSLNYRGSLSAYAISKAAMVRLTTMAAFQTARYHIDVNAIDVIGDTALTREISRRQQEDAIHAEWWRLRLERGHIPGPEVNDEMMLWLASPDSDGFTGRYVGWGMDLDDIKANKDKIIASPDALRATLSKPAYIRETDDVKKYRANSSQVLAQVESDVAPFQPPQNDA